MTAEAPLAQVVDRGSWRAPAPGSGPGCSAASGPANIAGKSVRTSISRVMRSGSADSAGSAGSDGSARSGAPSVGRRRVGAAPSARLPARRLGTVRIRRRASAAVAGRATSASTTISPRRGAKIRMNARTAGRSKLPNGAAVDGEHLGLADPVDVLDRPELLAVDAADGAADDLVPVVAARGPGPRRAGRPIRDTRRGARRRRRASVTSRKRSRQPGSVRDGLGRRDRQRPVVAFAEQDGADDEAVLRPVGQDLRADRPVEPVDAPDEGDHEPLVDRLRGSRAGPARRRGPRSP